VINVGSVVNGYTVLAVAAERHNVERALTDVPAVGLVILARRETGYGDEYVTARMAPDRDNQWMWGHYFHSRPRDAWGDFAERVTHRPS
jgi:hypothetical protein